MGIPSLAHWQPEGPAGRCVIQGHDVSWSNCTPASFAMAVDRSTLGVKRPTACDIRRQTGDTSGGTTLWQCRTAVEAHYGVHVDVYAGSTVVSPFWTAVQIQAGRSAVLQGNASALLSTSHRSTGGPVNHAVFVNSVRGGTQGEPKEALVYDPAADGRVSSWGRAAQGPQWWAWSDVKRFAAALRPWGDGDPRILGPGKFYVALFPDTEPHAHLHFGATKTSPFPDRVRVNVAAVWTHSTPAGGTANRIEPRLERDALFVTFQRVVKSGVLWLGNHDGTRWIRGDKVRNIGGTQ